MDVTEYVKAAREKKLSDERIFDELTVEGWSRAEARQALGWPAPPKGASAPVTVARAAQLARPESNPGHVTVEPLKETHPVTIENAGFSFIGFQYFIYFIALGFSVFGVAILLHESVVQVLNQETNLYTGMAQFAVSLLVVAAPIAIFLYLRLKKQELADPEIKRDKSRRRAVQLLMLVTFLVAIGRLMAFANNLIFSQDNLPGEQTMLEETLHALITIGTAGSLFIYYWLEQTKLSKR